jgi:hypothetical protein
LEHFYCWKIRPRAALFGFWLRDVQILQIYYTHEQRTIVDFPGFLEHGSAEKIAVCAHKHRDPNKQEVGFIFVWSRSELSSLFKNSKLKLKNQKPISVNDFLGTFQWHHSHADPIWPDGSFRENWINLNGLFTECCVRPDLLAVVSCTFSFFVFLFNFILLETIGTPLCMQQLNWNEEKRNIPRHSLIFLRSSTKTKSHLWTRVFFSNRKCVNITPVQLN